MSPLSSLHPDANVAVIGASGGIGRALIDQLCADSHVGAVLALSRSACDLTHPKLQCQLLDITDEAAIGEAAAIAAAGAPLDLVIVASGILHGPGLDPEKSMREWRPETLLKVMAVNAVGPAMVAKHFLPALRRRHKAVFAALSARVGSIADNRLGGWASYRASKAALNMLLRTLAIEQSRRWPESVIVSLHPGTVDTPLSKPFSKRVPDKQLFTPATAAARLLKVIDDLKPADSGGFFAWDGAPIAY